MIRVLRALAVSSLVASSIVLASCNDGLLHAPAAAEPAVVMMRALLAQTQGGAPEAFDRANRVFLRFRVGDEVRMEQELPFGASVATVVRLDVPLRHSSETMTADLELRFGDRPLFRGSATSTLKSGGQTPVEFLLEPVVDRVACGTGVLQLTAYGQTAQLLGVGLFATGDTVRGIPVTWSAPQNTAASVTAAGDVTALQDGDVDATCVAAGVTATRSIHVFAAVSSIQVAPSSATLAVGNSQAFTAALFDSRGNVISSSRPLAWSSGNSSVATVSSSGVVSALASGTARVSATSGTVVGGADVTVVSTGTVVTNAVIGISGTGATFFGTVNPRGTTVQAWFEFGTDPTLATSSSTTPRGMGNGTADVTFTEPVSGLTPNTTYYFRAVAGSVGGTVRGTILSFVTLSPPIASTLDLSLGQTIIVYGSVNPNGSAATAWFRYGTSSTLSTFSETVRQSVGSGTSAVTVSQTLSGLQSFTTYYVRMVGSGVGGTALGSILSFTTGGPPIIGATAGYLEGPCAGTYCAQLYGDVNPNRSATEAWFEWSTNPNFTTFSASAHQSVGGGTAVVTARLSLPIAFNQNVYFRAAASNAQGTVRSGVALAIPRPPA